MLPITIHPSKHASIRTRGSVAIGISGMELTWWVLPACLDVSAQNCSTLLFTFASTPGSPQLACRGSTHICGFHHWDDGKVRDGLGLSHWRLLQQHILCTSHDSPEHWHADPGPKVVGPCPCM